MSASNFHEYPKSKYFSDGIIVSLSTRSISSEQMFVAVGRGDSDGSVPITLRASLNVNFSVNIALCAGSYSGRVSLVLVLQGIVLVAIAASAIIGLM